MRLSRRVRIYANAPGNRILAGFQKQRAEKAARRTPFCGTLQTKAVRLDCTGVSERFEELGCDSEQASALGVGRSTELTTVPPEGGLALENTEIRCVVAKFHGSHGLSCAYQVRCWLLVRGESDRQRGFPDRIQPIFVGADGAAKQSGRTLVTTASQNNTKRRWCQ